MKLPDIVKSLDSKLAKMMTPILQRLKEENAAPGTFFNPANLTPWLVMQAQKDYQSRGDYRLKNQFNILRDLAQVRQLLKGHGAKMAKSCLLEFANKNYTGHIVKRPAFQSLVHEMGTACGDKMDESDGAAGAHSSHSAESNPKLAKLAEVLREHFKRKKDINKSTRAIVFSQWRESVGDIVKMLATGNASLIKPAQFIGQARKRKGNEKIGSSTSNAGPDAAGMNQKQQQLVSGSAQQDLLI